jgi:hypothetical protein
VYSNSIYGFSLTLPLGWPFAPVPKKVEVAVEDKTNSAIAKHLQITRVLMIATENAPFKKGNQRKSIQVVATQLAAKPVAGAEIDFIRFSENAAREKHMRVEYLGEPEELMIHGHKFGKIRLNDSSSAAESGGVLHVEQYVALQNQVMLQFLLVSPDDAGLQDLQPYIQTLKFDSPKTTAKGKKSTTTKGKSAKIPGAKQPQ